MKADLYKNFYGNPATKGGVEDALKGADELVKAITEAILG